MDGTGEEAYQGDILIEGNRIQEVSAVPITVSDCKVLDCAGMAIAPGFIDAHSHYDQLVCLPNELDYTEPFIRQGVTTYVAGQCGYSPAEFAATIRQVCCCQMIRGLGRGILTMNFLII